MKTIALFVHDPKCSVQSANGIMRALSPHYRFKIFGKNLLEDVIFDDVDMIAVPGGIGDADSFESLTKANRQQINQFIEQGGKYLGICMGAYWAGKDYFNILDKVDAVQYIKRPNACTRRPHAKNMPIMWKNQPYDMFFYDGCALVGDENSPYETIATYSNGDNMAIIQNRIGLIGCHPESEQFWYDGYSWMKGKYHNGEHHEILLDLIDEFLEK